MEWLQTQAGTPLAGVSVVEEGTPNGTISDMNGTYQIYVAPEATRLVFSFIGYETQRVRIGKSNQINVQLRPSLVELEEIVVVGRCHRTHGILRIECFSGESGR